MKVLILDQALRPLELIGLVLVLILFFALLAFVYWLLVKASLAMRLESAVDKKAPPEVQAEQSQKEMERFLRDLNSPDPYFSSNQWISLI